MIGLIMHDACRVMAAPPPILASSDFSVAIAARLFDAEGHRDEWVIVGKIEQDIGARELRGNGRSWPPLRCFERSVHSTQLNLGQDLIQHELPMIVDTVVLELVAYVFAVLLSEVVYRGRL